VENKPADLTPPEQRTPEEIEHEMLVTRQALTEKVAALEEAVAGNIHNVTQAAAQVKETVVGTVDTVKERVMSALDVSRHVRANPWAAVGVSAGFGFLVGYLAGPVTKSIPRRMSEAAVTPPEGAYAVPPTRAGRDESTGGGWLHGLTGGVLGDLGAKAARELRAIGERALDTALQSLRQQVETTVPHLVQNAVSGVVPGAGDGAAAGSGRPGYPPRM
jgi:ElaB/YqjD/DUF883 family membrane-anchored ribosome-binding protein